jgi:acyl carrier protein
MSMEVEQRVCSLLREVLGLPVHFVLERATPLLGSLAALDSVAVVTLLGECEDKFGFTVADAELSAEVFTTVGTLVDWVAARTTVSPGTAPSAS